MAKARSINVDSDEILAEGLLSDEAEVENVSTLDEEVEDKEEDEELVAEETEEIKPTAAPGVYDIIDDSARMYLHELGRVPLLKAHEEKILCRKIELGRYVERLRDNHFRKYQKSPSPVDIVIHVISQLSKGCPVAPGRPARGTGNWRDQEHHPGPVRVRLHGEDPGLGQRPEGTGRHAGTFQMPGSAGQDQTRIRLAG